jgi:hypothetical protein
VCSSDLPKTPKPLKYENLKILKIILLEMFVNKTEFHLLAFSSSSLAGGFLGYVGSDGINLL